MQYGSLVLMAPWLDLNQVHNVKSSFGVYILEGILKGVEDTVALVRIATQDPQPTWFLNSPEPSGSDLNEALQIDHPKIKTQIAILQADCSIFRLMIILKTESSLRLIDLTWTLLGGDNAFIPKCKHEPSRVENHVNSTKLIMVYDFNSILCCWDLDNGPRTWDSIASIKITQMLDQNIKLNAACSLTRCYVLRDKTQCCLACAISMADSARVPRVINYDLLSTKKLRIEGFSKNLTTADKNPSGEKLNDNNLVVLKGPTTRHIEPWNLSMSNRMKQARGVQRMKIKET